MITLQLTEDEFSALRDIIDFHDIKDLPEYVAEAFRTLQEKVAVPVSGEAFTTTRHFSRKEREKLLLHVDNTWKDLVELRSNNTNRVLDEDLAMAQHELEGLRRKVKFWVDEAPEE